MTWLWWPDWRAFASELPAHARLWFIESGGPRHYAEAGFGPDDYLVFGRETAGLPAALLAQHRDRWLQIALFNPASRSLNLSNCIALVLYEALRQQGFAGAIPSASRTQPAHVATVGSSAWSTDGSRSCGWSRCESL